MELHIHISNHLTRNINYLNLSSIHLRIVADHSELKQAVNQLCTPLLNGVNPYIIIFIASNNCINVSIN